MWQGRAGNRSPYADFSQALRAKSRRDAGATDLKGAGLEAAASKSKSAAGEASLAERVLSLGLQAAKKRRQAAALHMRLAGTRAGCEMLLLDSQPRVVDGLLLVRRVFHRL